MFTVRPEKIRLAEPDEAPADDEGSALGTVREVVYLGPDTRYIVALDAGGELVVTAAEPADIVDGGACRRRADRSG